MQDKINRKLYLLPLLFLVVWFLYANQTTFLQAEDFSYSFVLQSDYSYLKVANFNDVIKSTTDYFYNNSGRLFANFINTFFLFLGLDVFKVINGLIVASTIYLLINWITNNATWKKKLFVSVSLVAALFFVSASVFDEVFIWHTGAMFYSVPTLAILLFLTPFIYAIQNRKFIIQNKVCKYVYGVITAFAAAFIPENYSLTVVAICLVILIYIYARDRIIDKTLLVYFIVHFIFTMICVFAPGSMSRMGGENRGLSISLGTLTQYFKYQFVMIPFATLVFILATMMLFNKTINKKYLTIIIVALLVPVLLASVLNTHWLYSSNIIKSEFITYLRMPDDFYLWSGANKMMIITVGYYLLVIACLLVIYIYISFKNDDIFLFVLLMGSTLPILSLIFVGGAEQRVAYLSFLSTVTLSLYVLFNYFDYQNKYIRVILTIIILCGILSFTHHFDYISENISIVAKRNAILENLVNTEGDVILPRVRATVHGSVGEDTWDYWVMREYYGIQDRKVITE